MNGRKLVGKPSLMADLPTPGSRVLEVIGGCDHSLYGHKKIAKNCQLYGAKFTLQLLKLN